MNILICDDSRVSLNINRVYIEEFARKRNIPVHIYDSLRIDGQLEELISKEKIDMAILDIDFNSKKEGILFGTTLLKKQPLTVLIFITNHAEYAMDAYNIIPFGFLQKPIAEEKFERLFVRALLQINGIIATKNNRKIEVISNGTPQIMKENNILYIEKSGHVAEITTKSGIYSVYDTLKNLEQSLSSCFLKINKGIVINMNHVMELTNKTVTMKDGKVLPVSQRKVKFVQQELRNHLEGFH